ncbi:Integrase [Pseudomonas sp. IT-P258]|uniref:hypothetical protein n=1 Tax=Pseudomonas sp. IT-P258 TaxID=3026447 RepID=UPI0039E05749
MTQSLEIFGLRRTSDWLTPAHRSFRPPSWPPPRDWIVSEDQRGNVLSLWGDFVWDITPWAGVSMILNFGDGPNPGRSERIDSTNADLLRLITTWRMWGIKSCRSANGMKSVFHMFRRIIALCSQKKIPASKLSKSPKVLEEISKRIPPSEYSTTILELHRLWDARTHLGFILVDLAAIKRLAAATPLHDIEQTAYIPPRIWSYQVARLKLCLDEYLQNQKSIEDCFDFCTAAYTHNYGSLKSALTKKIRHLLPFGQHKYKNKGKRTGARYYGKFQITTDRYHISDLIKRWVDTPTKGIEIRNFSNYLSLIQYTGIAYIANFTLQRITEVSSLRSDCLIWEKDEKLGCIPIIVGETTKTISDSDARWPTSPSVEAAVKAMHSVARMRMICSVEDPKIQATENEINNPYLYGCASEPWSSRNNRTNTFGGRVNVNAYKNASRQFNLLFDDDKLRITEEDLRIARMLTPNLRVDFKIGAVWPLSWHQLRRTGAVNMFASGLISDSSMQFLMKHTSKIMPLYYGRGYTKLLLNEEVEKVIIRAMYETMPLKISNAIGERFVSPLGKERKDAVLVNLVSDKDAKQLVSAARRGLIHFREIRVGVCTHRGSCPYGGIESISRCTGGDGDGPCADALYDREKASDFMIELSIIDSELEKNPVDSPRHKALLAERQGMENFLNVVSE